MPCIRRSVFHTRLQICTLLGEVPGHFRNPGLQPLYTGQNHSRFRQFLPEKYSCTGKPGIHPNLDIHRYKSPRYPGTHHHQNKHRSCDPAVHRKGPRHVL